jgi:hypothetical protein
MFEGLINGLILLTEIPNCSTSQSSALLSIAQDQIAMFQEAMEIFGSRESNKSLKMLRRTIHDSVWINVNLNDYMRLFLWDERDQELSMAERTENRETIKAFHQKWLEYSKNYIMTSSTLCDVSISLQDAYWSMMQTLAKTLSLFWMLILLGDRNRQECEISSLLNTYWEKFSLILPIIPDVEVQSNMNIVLIQNLLSWIKNDLMVLPSTSALMLNQLILMRLVPSRRIATLKKRGRMMRMTMKVKQTRRYLKCLMS